MSCAAATLFSATSEARQGVAGIRGRVTDEQKGVLPGATVTATHRESGIARNHQRQRWHLLHPLTGPGPYRLEAQLAGFNKYQVEDILLRVGATVQIDCTLQVGGLTESVTVTSEAPQVDLTEVGGTVNSAELTNLPSGNRNFTSFVALLPGVVYNPTSDSSSDNVTINGQHGSGVVFLMDGGSNNDDLRGGKRRRTGPHAARGDPGVPGRHQPVRCRLRRRHGRRHQRGQQAGHQRDPRERVRLLHQPGPDRQGLLRGAAGPGEARGAAPAVGGTVGGPIVQDKMHFFVSFERSDLDEGRSRVYNTRPDKSFTATQEILYNTLGRVDHQLSNDKNYSVRVLWDHQPNYNQVLGDGTINTLYTEKDDDVTLVGVQLDHDADPAPDDVGLVRPGAPGSRHAAILRSALVRGAADARLPQLLRRQRVRGRPQDAGLRLRHALHLVCPRPHRQPRHQVGPAVSARRAPARRPAVYQRQLRVPDRPGLQPGRSPDLSRTPDDPRAGQARLLSRTHSIGTYIHDNGKRRRT